MGLELAVFCLDWRVDDLLVRVCLAAWQAPCRAMEGPRFSEPGHGSGRCRPGQRGRRESSSGSGNRLESGTKSMARGPIAVDDQLVPGSRRVHINVAALRSESSQSQSIAKAPVLGFTRVGPASGDAGIWYPGRPPGPETLAHANNRTERAIAGPSWAPGITLALRAGRRSRPSQGFPIPVRSDLGDCCGPPCSRAGNVQARRRCLRRKPRGTLSWWVSRCNAAPRTGCTSTQRPPRAVCSARESRPRRKLRARSAAARSRLELPQCCCAPAFCSRGLGNEVPRGAEQGLQRRSARSRARRFWMLTHLVRGLPRDRTTASRTPR
jgi:hypothetical protein